jgi:Domain of unknown function (DUF892)
MGMAENIQDQLVTYLKDAHALEQMSLQMTETAAKATDDPQLHELFQHHHDETEEHERLIRERIEAHGESTSKLRSSAAGSRRWRRESRPRAPRIRTGGWSVTAMCRSKPKSRRTSFSAAWRSVPATHRPPK